MNLAYWLNTAWMAKCRGEATAFDRASRHVGQTQCDLLLDLLRRNAQTEYGRKNGFARIKSPQEYQRHVPLASYESFAEQIQRIASGVRNVLTRDPVLLLEPTSGTTRGEKLIPYTGTLRRQFQRMVAAWIYDLLSRRPAIRTGRAYWSISPATIQERRSTGGIPIGFDDDTGYLGGLERFIINGLLAVPSSVAKIRDVDEFRYRTLLHLIRARDLTLISIWSPTFLETLFSPLEAWSERLAFDIRDDDAELARLLAADAPIDKKLARIWPRLSLISCWADGAASRYLDRIRALFPHVEIQPKGLLATEGCVSFPLTERDGAALAIRSHYFEFQEHDADENDFAACHLAQELEMGGRYRVVLTTGGGLYRYRLGDLVEVAGFHHDCPMLRFLGRAGLVSDLVGEKLDEAFVAAVLNHILQSHGVSPRFSLLAPEEATGMIAPRYRLFLQAAGMAPDDQAQGLLAATLESELRANPHYRHAVAVGQLAPAEVTILAEGSWAWSVFERRRLVQGQKAGDIKPASLDSWTGWIKDFRNHQPAAPK